MISAKLNGRHLVLVPIAKGAEAKIVRYFGSWHLIHGGPRINLTGAFPGKYLNFLTTSDSITEEQAREILPENLNEDKTYLECFATLLRSIGCKQGTNYAILEKL